MTQDHRPSARTCICTSTMRLVIPLIVSGVLGACGTQEVSGDSGEADAAHTADGGDSATPQDAGRADTETDASETDAGETDAGETDAGETDATDASVPDTSECLVWDPAGRQSLMIERALFGSGNTWADNTAAFQALVRNDWLYYHVYRTYIDMGDPVPGSDKVLRLTYRLDGKQQPEQTYDEGEIVYINVPPQNLACCHWQLLSAKWGASQTTAIDVTTELKRHILDCELDFYCFSSNELGGDPAPGAMKHLFITYRQDGNDKTFVCDEEGAHNHIFIQ